MVYLKNAYRHYHGVALIYKTEQTYEYKQSHGTAV